MAMNEILQSGAFQWFSQFAYHPEYVYVGLFVMMIASAFGLPLPEEVTLISVGFLAFMGSRPDLYPPPYEGASVVNKHEIAWFAFLAVVLSDTLIYVLGRKFGRKIITHPRMHRFISAETLNKVENWTHKYGPMAVFIFRFTPGVRFPGHLFCGMMKYSIGKFLAIDAFAALISVPTQVYLIAFYGDQILTVLHRFKIFFFGLITLVVIYVLFKKWRERQNKALSS